MSDQILIDNDIVLKACCYDLDEELAACVLVGERSLYALGVIDFVIRKRISRSKGIKNKECAAGNLDRMLARVNRIEPEAGELELAAALEDDALRRGLDLDSGESQLLAILILRSASLLLTGDKRAIRAIEAIIQTSDRGGDAARRVGCFEQVVMAILGRLGVEALHSKICSEPGVDGALSICFSCASGLLNPESILEGLVSFISDLRRSAPCVLIDSDDLSAVIP